MNIVLWCLLFPFFREALFPITQARPILSSDKKSEREKQLLNLPSTPLVMSLSPNGNYIGFGNVSKKKIIGFILGCVVKKEGDEDGEIIKTGTLIGANLRPSKESKLVYTKIVYLESLEVYSACLKEKEGAKMAIVEVIFSDKSKWKAQNIRGIKNMK